MGEVVPYQSPLQGEDSGRAGALQRLHAASPAAPAEGVRAALLEVEAPSEEGSVFPTIPIQLLLLVLPDRNHSNQVDLDFSGCCWIRLFHPQVFSESHPGWSHRIVQRIIGILRLGKISKVIWFRLGKALEIIMEWFGMGL